MKYTPYRKSAKYALMNWNGLTEEQAEEAIKTQSWDELQGQTWAEDSMKAAAVAFAKELNMTPEQTQVFVELVLGKNNVELSTEEVEFFKYFAPVFESVKDKGELVVRVLCEIHNDWVKNTAKKFNKPGKEHQKYQHLPLQMIGLAEAGSDYVFFKTILDTMGVEVSEAEIEQAYQKMAVEFYDENGMLNEQGIDKEAVIKKIMQGKKFYPSLTEGVNEATDKEVATLVAEQSMSKMSNVKMRG